MKDRQRIEILVSRYWDATITDIEKVELYQLLQQKEQLDDELMVLRIMLGAFEEIGNDYKTCATHRGERIRHRTLKVVSTIGAAALILIIYLVSHNSIDQKSQSEIYCYINGEPITDIDVALEQMVYFEHISELSETIISLESLL